MGVRVLGIGGTYRPLSSTEQSLRIALASAAAHGAEIELLGAEALDLPMFRPAADAALTAKALHLVTEVRRADALIIGSPGYHGGISGLVKNALDYLEELRADPHPYLHGKAVGLITTGAGWQATSTTMAALRDVVHALRGWPTPLGVGVNTSEVKFAADGACSSAQVAEQLRLVGEQVTKFALRGALV